MEHIIAIRGKSKNRVVKKEAASSKIKIRKKLKSGKTEKKGVPC